MPHPLVDLVAFSAAPTTDTVRIAAAVAMDARGLVLSFVLRGDLSALAIASRAARPARRDRLWEHTCCEAFVGVPDGDAYLEVNLSPSGDWALWAFDAYRAGMRAAATVAPPALRVLPGATELRLDAIVDHAVPAGFLGAPPYLVGLAAVIEDRAGERSFFALRHAADRPDFHARDTWLATVYPPPDA